MSEEQKNCESASATSNVRALHPTILRNINRKKNFLDAHVQYCDDGMPLFSWLELSPVDMCNRSCVFCPRSNDDVAPNQALYMPRKLYESMASELAELGYQGTVAIAGYGEPMMHPEIYDMLAAFSAVCNTELITNGDFLNVKRIRQIHETGCDKILVSLYDGPHQVTKFEKMFKEAGIPRETWFLRDRWYDEDEEYGLKLTNRAGLVQIGDQPELDLTRPCFYTHYSMTIEWNGDTFLCPQDWHRRVKPGNVMVQSLLEVWRSKGLQKFRSMLGAGRRTASPCNNCNADGMIHGENHFKGFQNYKAQKKKAHVSQKGKVVAS